MESIQVRNNNTLFLIVIAGMIEPKGIPDVDTADSSSRANVPLEDSNIGNKLLKSMGWSEGKGLGAKGQGKLGVSDFKMFFRNYQSYRCRTTSPRGGIRRSKQQGRYNPQGTYSTSDNGAIQEYS
jgi:hypothetical protein